MGLEAQKPLLAWSSARRVRTWSLPLEYSVVSCRPLSRALFGAAVPSEKATLIGAEALSERLRTVVSLRIRYGSVPAPLSGETT